MTGVERAEQAEPDTPAETGDDWDWDQLLPDGVNSWAEWTDR